MRIAALEQAVRSRGFRCPRLTILYGRRLGHDSIVGRVHPPVNSEALPEVVHASRNRAFPPAILIMAHSYSRNRNRYRGRIPCFLVDFGPDPDLDPDSGCHN
jgi:hypothetical protein